MHPHFKDWQTRKEKESQWKIHVRIMSKGIKRLHIIIHFQCSAPVHNSGRRQCSSFLSQHWHVYSPTLLKIGCYRNTFRGVRLNVPVWLPRGVTMGCWVTPYGCYRMGHYVILGCYFQPEVSRCWKHDLKSMLVFHILHINYESYVEKQVHSIRV
jgi:hypothetical protein